MILIECIKGEMSVCKWRSSEGDSQNTDITCLMLNMKGLNEKLPCYLNDRGKWMVPITMLHKTHFPNEKLVRVERIMHMLTKEGLTAMSSLETKTLKNWLKCGSLCDKNNDPFPPLTETEMACSIIDVQEKITQVKEAVNESTNAQKPQGSATSLSTSQRGPSRKSLGMYSDSFDGSEAASSNLQRDTEESTDFRSSDDEDVNLQDTKDRTTVGMQQGRKSFPSSSKYTVSLKRKITKNSRNTSLENESEQKVPKRRFTETPRQVAKPVSVIKKVSPSHEITPNKESVALLKKANLKQSLSEPKHPTVSSQIVSVSSQSFKSNITQATKNSSLKDDTSLKKFTETSEINNYRMKGDAKSNRKQKLEKKKRGERHLKLPNKMGIESAVTLNPVSTVCRKASYQSCNEKICQVKTISKNEKPVDTKHFSGYSSSTGFPLTDRTFPVRQPSSVIIPVPKETSVPKSSRIAKTQSNESGASTKENAPIKNVNNNNTSSCFGHVLNELQEETAKKKLVLKKSTNVPKISRNSSTEKSIKVMRKFTKLTHSDDNGTKKYNLPQKRDNTFLDDLKLKEVSPSKIKKGHLDHRTASFNAKEKICWKNKYRRFQKSSPQYNSNVQVSPAYHGSGGDDFLHNRHEKKPLLETPPRPMTQQAIPFNQNFVSPFSQDIQKSYQQRPFNERKTRPFLPLQSYDDHSPLRDDYVQPRRVEANAFRPQTLQRPFQRQMFTRVFPRHNHQNMMPFQTNRLAFNRPHQRCSNFVNYWRFKNPEKPFSEDNEKIQVEQDYEENLYITEESVQRTFATKSHWKNPTSRRNNDLTRKVKNEIPSSFTSEKVFESMSQSVDNENNAKNPAAFFCTPRPVSSAEIENNLKTLISNARKKAATNNSLKVTAKPKPTFIEETKAVPCPHIVKSKVLPSRKKTIKKSQRRQNQKSTQNTKVVNKSSEFQTSSTPTNAQVEHEVSLMINDFVTLDEDWEDDNNMPVSAAKDNNSLTNEQKESAKTDTIATCEKQKLDERGKTQWPFSSSYVDFGKEIFFDLCGAENSDDDTSSLKADDGEKSEQEPSTQEPGSRPRRQWKKIMLQKATQQAHILENSSISASTGNTKTLSSKNVLKAVKSLMESMLKTVASRSVSEHLRKENNSISTKQKKANNNVERSKKHNKIKRVGHSKKLSYSSAEKSKETKLISGVVVDEAESLLKIVSKQSQSKNHSMGNKDSEARTVSSKSVNVEEETVVSKHSFSDSQASKENDGTNVQAQDLMVEEINRNDKTSHASNTSNNTNAVRRQKAKKTIMRPKKVSLPNNDNHLTKPVELKETDLTSNALRVTLTPLPASSVAFRLLKRRTHLPSISSDEEEFNKLKDEENRSSASNSPLPYYDNDVIDDDDDDVLISCESFLPNASRMFTQEVDQPDGSNQRRIKQESVQSPSQGHSKRTNRRKATCRASRKPLNPDEQSKDASTISSATTFMSNSSSEKSANNPTNPHFLRSIQKNKQSHKSVRSKKKDTTASLGNSKSSHNAANVQRKRDQDRLDHRRSTSSDTKEKVANNNGNANTSEGDDQRKHSQKVVNKDNRSSGDSLHETRLEELEVKQKDHVETGDSHNRGEVIAADRKKSFDANSCETSSLDIPSSDNKNPAQDITSSTAVGKETSESNVRPSGTQVHSSLYNNRFLPDSSASTNPTVSSNSFTVSPTQPTCTTEPVVYCGTSTSSSSAKCSTLSSSKTLRSAERRVQEFIGNGTEFTNASENNELSLKPSSASSSTSSTDSVVSVPIAESQCMSTVSKPRLETVSSMQKSPVSETSTLLHGASNDVDRMTISNQNNQNTFPHAKPATEPTQNNSQPENELTESYYHGLLEVEMRAPALFVHMKGNPTLDQTATFMFCRRRIPYIQIKKQLQRNSTEIEQHSSDCQAKGKDCSGKVEMEALLVRIRDAAFTLRQSTKMLLANLAQHEMKCYYPNEFAEKIYDQIYNPVGKSSPAMLSHLGYDLPNTLNPTNEDSMINLDDYLKVLIPNFYKDNFGIDKQNLPDLIKVRTYKTIQELTPHVIQTFSNSYSYNCVLIGEDLNIKKVPNTAGKRISKGRTATKTIKRRKLSEDLRGVHVTGQPKVQEKNIPTKKQSDNLILSDQSTLLSQVYVNPGALNNLMSRRDLPSATIATTESISSRAKPRFQDHRTPFKSLLPAHTRIVIARNQSNSVASRVRQNAIVLIPHSVSSSAHVSNSIQSLGVPHLSKQYIFHEHKPLELDKQLPGQPPSPIPKEIEMFSNISGRSSESLRTTSQFPLTPHARHIRPVCSVDVSHPDNTRTARNFHVTSSIANSIEAQTSRSSLNSNQDNLTIGAKFIIENDCRKNDSPRSFSDLQQLLSSIVPADISKKNSNGNNNQSTSGLLQTEHELSTGKVVKNLPFDNVETPLDLTLRSQQTNKLEMKPNDNPVVTSSLPQTSSQSSRMYKVDLSNGSVSPMASRRKKIRADISSTQTSVDPTLRIESIFTLSNLGEKNSGMTTTEFFNNVTKNTETAHDAHDNDTSSIVAKIRDLKKPLLEELSTPKMTQKVEKRNKKKENLKKKSGAFV